MITQSPAQVGEDLASFLFSTMLRDFPEELRRFVFLGHALATLVSTMMRSGEMRCGKLLWYGRQEERSTQTIYQLAFVLALVSAAVISVLQKLCMMHSTTALG